LYRLKDYFLGPRDFFIASDSIFPGIGGFCHAKSGGIAVH
jgi:hypothetical protein